MSIELQKQIRDNSTSVHEYFQDLVRWTDDQEKQERRRILKKQVAHTECDAPASLPTSFSPGDSDEAAFPRPSTACVENHNAKSTVDAGRKLSHEGNENDGSIARDRLPMPQYYHNWDTFDADGEIEKLDCAALKMQQKEHDARQAERDRILDELAINSAGDRSRTSAARPRVKISVRTSGRRASPVDLAYPKKQEANKLFAAHRFRDALAMYTSTLDLLEKYEPPKDHKENKENRAERHGTEQPGGRAGDLVGDDMEAVSLKATLLANRAAACFKLGEWRDAVDDCTEALRYEPSHHKAILRRGMAFSKMKRWSLAARDLTRAVSHDATDKKAHAELKMVRRKLEEHLQECRSHARCMVVDPLRQSTIPTRRLVVNVFRAGAAQDNNSDIRAMTSPINIQEPAGSSLMASTSSCSAQPPQSCAARQPYVPRSVRIRGRQTVAGAPAHALAGQGSGSRSVAGSGPMRGNCAMSYYAFERQWMQNCMPQERVQLLQRVGAAGLPHVLRESLDAELLVSILEAFRFELNSNPESTSSTAQHAVETLSALARTPRFNLSVCGLSQAEHRLCLEVLATLEVHHRVQEEQADSCSNLATLRALFLQSQLKAPQSDADVPNMHETSGQGSGGAFGESQHHVPQDAAQLPNDFCLDGCD